MLAFEEYERRMSYGHEDIPSFLEKTPAQTYGAYAPFVYSPRPFGPRKKNDSTTPTPYRTPTPLFSGLPEIDDPLHSQHDQGQQELGQLNDLRLGNMPKSYDIKRNHSCYVPARTRQNQNS
eukprot:GHVP01023078.1.p1 GENE.GHVP01023078.1~~GHVP01023078.1.p1  ORF type:complete len:121 (+),score=8.88 GHVP01023078.1:229-591(+)